MPKPFRSDPKPEVPKKEPRKRGYKLYKRGGLNRRVLLKYKPKELPTSALDLTNIKKKLQKRKWTVDKSVDDAYHNQWEAFNALYYGTPKSERCCIECGVYIPEPFKPSNVHHILAKGMHRLLKYRVENLVICCEKCHDIYTFGLRADIEATKLYSDTERIEKLKALSKKLAAER